jgi:hypothetical protein
MTKTKTATANSLKLLFLILNIYILDLFRVSIFVFRICYPYLSDILACPLLFINVVDAIKNE